MLWCLVQFFDILIPSELGWRRLLVKAFISTRDMVGEVNDEMKSFA